MIRYFGIGISQIIFIILCNSLDNETNNFSSTKLSISDEEDDIWLLACNQLRTDGDRQ